jgi:signal transduction histidine kinase
MAPTDRTLRGLAWAAALFYLVAAAFSVVTYLVTNPVFSDWGTSGRPTQVLFMLMITAFPAVGLLITRHQPRNRIAWLLLAIGLTWAATAIGDTYVQLALVSRPGSLPGGGAVEALNSSLWVPPIVLMGVYVLLLFPDGHLPSPRWRVPAWVVAVDAALVMAGIALQKGPVTDVAAPLEANPLGVLPAGVTNALFVVALPLLPLSIIAAAVALVVRFRRATGVRRLQLKWLMAAGAVVALLYAATMALSLFAFSRSGGGDAPWMLVLQNTAILTFGLIPVAIGIAITRHGLYEIDALISRALVVGALGLFITGVYVAVVVGLGSLIGQRHPSVLLSVVATACVAVLFQPVRERITRGVNRMVYGSRATPYEVLSDFATSMAGTYTTAELLPRIAQTLSEFLGGARVQVWLRTGRLLEREAVWPADGALPDPVELTEPDRVTGLEATRVVPVRHREELLGVITLSKALAEPVTPTEDEMLQHVASQTGLVLRNLRLVDDLHGSRQRLVTSQDDQRRALERDLHDGAQQSLVAIALTLRLATRQRDPSALSASASQAADQLQGAIAELRELARGLHPAILTDRGLGPALTSLAERCPVPVNVDNQVARRLPGPVEGALYFVAAESLTNIAKHARANEVTLRLSDDGDSVSLEVRDDGVGGADPARGSGLLGLADRVAVVDGEFTVHSPVGRGTTTLCVVPVPSEIPAQRTASSPVGATTGRSR